MLLQIPDVLEPEHVERTRSALEGATWIDGRATAGHLAVRVKDNQQLAHDDPLARRLGDEILQRLGALPSFIAAALRHEGAAPHFNRYAGGGQYANHVDNAIRTIAGTPHRVRTDISATLFLSQPDEYDGGELVIEDSYGSHTIKQPAGSLVLYRDEPASRCTGHARRALRLFSGCRASCATIRNARCCSSSTTQSGSLPWPHPGMPRWTS